MRVAMIGLRGIPSLDGGVEVAVGELAPRIVDLGIDVVVYCRTPYVSDRLKSYNGVQLVNLPTINSKHFEAITHTLLATLHAVFINRIDVIHYHALGNALFSKFPRLFGKKCVVTIHGFDYQREKWAKCAKYVLKLGELQAVRYADSIISVSQKIKRELERRYPRNVDWLPNGIPSMAKGRSVGGRPYVLFLSRLVPEKGAHTLIEAFKSITHDMELLIVGAGTHTSNYVESLKQLGEGDARIKFLGPKYDQEKSNLLHNSALFVLPSTIEGMPIVLLEAMSFGTPCLVSDIQENLDVIQTSFGELGYFFKTGDVTALSDKMQELLEEPLKMNAKSTLAGKVVKDLYNWDRIALQTSKVYYQLFE